MDSYAINNTIDQGHAMTQSNMDYNQRVASARNQIQDTFNQTSKQDKTTQDRDKDIYELHDTIQSLSAGAKIPVLKESWGHLRNSKPFFGQQLDYAAQKNPALYDALGYGQGSSESTPASEPERTSTADYGDVNLSLDEQGRVQGIPEEPLPSAVQSNAGTNETAVPTDEGTPPATEGGANLTEETAEATTSAVGTAGSGSKLDELIGKVGDYASKVATPLRIAGNIGGYIDAGEVLSGHAHGDTIQKVSEWTQGAGAILDTIGLAVPILEPIGAALQLGGAIADSLETHKVDAQNLKDDQTNEDTALAQQKTQTNTPLSSLGLLATQNNHLANISQSSVGAF